MEPTIRLATETDAEGIATIYAPIVEGTAISFEIEPPSVEAMQSRIVETTGRFPWLVCERDGDVLGYAYASEHSARPAYQWTVDVSVYVHERHQRAGIGQGLYESLFAALRHQGYCVACAVIALPNEASVRLHESMGFEPVGVYRSIGYKHGAWHDVGWWQLSLRDRPTSPDPPTPVADIRATAAWDEAMATGVRSIEA